MIDKTYNIEAALYLKGDNLDPNYISDLLGIAASRSQYKGEKRVTSSNRDVVSKTGLWALVITRTSGSISDALTELTSQINSSKYLLADIQGVEEAYLDVFIATDANEDGGGTCSFQLNIENIMQLEKLKMPIKFTTAIVQK